MMLKMLPFVALLPAPGAAGAGAAAATVPAPNCANASGTSSSSATGNHQASNEKMETLEIDACEACGPIRGVSSPHTCRRFAEKRGSH